MKYRTIGRDAVTGRFISIDTALCHPHVGRRNDGGADPHRPPPAPPHGSREPPEALTSIHAVVPVGRAARRAPRFARSAGAVGPGW